MTARKDDPYRLMWMLGLALTLPMILVSGPIAGYLIGYVFVRHFGSPFFLIPLLMGLGLLASGLQSYRLIKRLAQFKNSEKKK